MSTKKAIIAGSTLAIEQPIKQTYNQRTGWRTTRRWRGPLNSIGPLIGPLQLTGWDLQLDSSNGQVWELTATAGYNWAVTGVSDNPVDTWELESNKVEKDFLNSRNPVVASLTKSDINILQSVLDNPQYPPATAPTDSDGTALTDAGNTAYALLLSGVKSDIIFVPVLKHTQITSSAYAIAASFANVGAIISTATLARILPNALAFNMPPDPAYGKTGFAFGWLKDAPNVAVSAFNKTQIQQNYEFGLWNIQMKGSPL